MRPDRVELWVLSRADRLAFVEDALKVVQQALDFLVDPFRLGFVLEQPGIEPNQPNENEQKNRNWRGTQ